MLQPHTAFPTRSGTSGEQGVLIGAPPSALQSGPVPPRLCGCEFTERSECSGENLESRTCPDKMQGASAQDETTRQSISSRTGMRIEKNQRAPCLFATHTQPQPAVLVVPARRCAWWGCEWAVAPSGTTASCSSRGFISQSWERSSWSGPARPTSGLQRALSWGHLFISPGLCGREHWWGARWHTNRLARLLARVCSVLISAFCFHEAWFLIV